MYEMSEGVEKWEGRSAIETYLWRRMNSFSFIFV
jgi:hypothetical protein